MTSFVIIVVILPIFIDVRGHIYYLRRTILVHSGSTSTAGGTLRFDLIHLAAIWSGDISSFINPPRSSISGVGTTLPVRQCCLTFVKSPSPFYPPFLVPPSSSCCVGRACFCKGVIQGIARISEHSSSHRLVLGIPTHGFWPLPSRPQVLESLCSFMCWPSRFADCLASR